MSNRDLTHPVVFDTPRSGHAWHEARYGENPSALYEESQKLERELTAAIERAEKAEAEAARWRYNPGGAVTVAIERIQTQRDQWREVAGRLRRPTSDYMRCQAYDAYDALIEKENGGGQ